MLINYDGDVLTVDSKVMDFDFKWCEPFFVDTLKPLSDQRLAKVVNSILWKMPYVWHPDCLIRQFVLDATVAIGVDETGYFWQVWFDNHEAILSKKRFGSQESANIDFELKVLDRPAAVGKDWWIYTNNEEYVIVQAAETGAFAFGYAFARNYYGTLRQAKLAAVESLDLEPDFNLLRII